MQPTARDKKNPASSSIDEDAVTELQLFIENDGDLYRQRTLPIMRNLSRKWKKGQFDSDKAVQAFKYLVDDGAKKYAKEFGGTWNRTFPTDVRREVARRLARQFEAEAELGNLVENPASSSMDEDAGTELQLFIENDGDLYRQRTLPIMRNLSRKWKKGQFDSDKAVQAFKYLVDDGAKKYAKEFGGTWNRTLPADVRREVARRLARQFEAEAELGNLVENPSQHTEQRSYVLKGFSHLEEKEVFKKISGKKNPASSKGKRVMRDIGAGGYGKRTPEVAALLSDILKKGSPSTIRQIQDMARKRSVEEPLSQVLDRWVEEGKLDAYTRAGRSAYGPPQRKNPASGETWQQVAFRDGAAKALWASLFSTELYSLEEDGYDDLYQDLRPGEGEDIMDHLPPLPEAALEDAKNFERELVKANKVRSIEDLLNRAAVADGVEEVDVEDFGHYTMMPALGEGVSWFDDHGDFKLYLPSWEQSSDVHNAMHDFLEEKKQEYED